MYIVIHLQLCVVRPFAPLYLFHSSFNLKLLPLNSRTESWLCLYQPASQPSSWRYDTSRPRAYICHTSVRDVMMPAQKEGEIKIKRVLKTMPSWGRTEEEEILISKQDGMGTDARHERRCWVPILMMMIIIIIMNMKTSLPPSLQEYKARSLKPCVYLSLYTRQKEEGRDMNSYQYI